MRLSKAAMSSLETLCSLMSESSSGASIFLCEVGAVSLALMLLAVGINEVRPLTGRPTVKVGRNSTPESQQMFPSFGLNFDSDFQSSSNKVCCKCRDQDVSWDLRLNSWENGDSRFKSDPNPPGPPRTAASLAYKLCASFPSCLYVQKTAEQAT